MKLVFITVFCIISLGQWNISNGFSLKYTLCWLESVSEYAHLKCARMAVDDSNFDSDSDSNPTPTPAPTPTGAHAPINVHPNSSATNINTTAQQDDEYFILGMTESQFEILSVVTLVVLGGIGLIFLYLTIRDNRKIRAEQQRRQIKLNLCKQNKAAPNEYVVQF